MSKLLLLVDGSAYLYQAFYATSASNLTNAQGEPTGAIYGFVNMLRKVLNQYQPDKVAVVFDAKGGSFRSEMYADYKATRDSMPSDLQKQIDPIHEIVKAMGIQTLIIDNVEADDVIGTLAKEAEKQDYPVLIHSGDKDMAQLVSSKIHLLTTRDVLLTSKEVNEKFGVPPCKIIDFLALKGDASDNIPGVPSIGDKSATVLLNHFDHLNDLYLRIDEIDTLKLRGAKSIKQKLIDHEDLARLSYTLATIKTDVDLPLSLSDLDWSNIDAPALLALFQTYHLKQYSDAILQNKLFKSSKPTQYFIEKQDEPVENEVDANKNQEKKYHSITKESQLDELILKLKQAPLIAFDTETDSIDALNCHLVGISFSIAPHEAFYIPLGHHYENCPKQLDLNITLTKLKPILEDQKIPKVGQNCKFDSHVLAQYEIKVANIAFDTMLESYLINSQDRHDLDSLAEHYLNYKTIPFDDLFNDIEDKKLKKQATIADISIEKASFYACEDADITLQLHHKLINRLQKTPKLLHLLSDLEMPISQILTEMETTGVQIDEKELKHYSIELEAKLQDLEVKICELAQKKININSPKQLQTVLYEEMNLPILKKTPKGDPSTNEEVLLELAKYYELPKLILDYRGAFKLKTTYTDKLPLMRSSKDHRIHTNYNQIGTITGRLSSNDPNLQNIPVKNEDGRKIREAFVARPGYLIVSADYSQIELRIMAHLSKDPNLLTAFHENKDIHSVTAAEILNKAEHEITQEERRRAKAVNFGLIYGMSAFGLAKQIDIPRKEAQFYIDRYFERYPAVLNYMDSMRELAHQQGYVETLLGRRLYLSKINSKSEKERKSAERAAINAPMQGTAADIIKCAMIDISKLIKDQKEAEIILLMQVHDELVFEVKKDCLDEMLTKIKSTMEQCFKLEVPLKVEIGSGSNWSQSH